MQRARSTLCALALALPLPPSLTLTACVFDSDEDPDEDPDDYATGTESGGASFRGLYPVSERWGPCLPQGWGCIGELGVELACLRPVNDPELSICVLQRWASAVEDDCSNVENPGFAYGVTTPNLNYCLGECGIDSHCLDGMLCSAHGTCAWPED